jgi:hypothetical protein
MTVSSGDTVILNNVTITGNSAGGQGGGIRRNSGTVNVGNTILCANTATSGGPDISSSAGGILSQGHNIICDYSGGGWTGTPGDIVGDSGSVGAIDPDEVLESTLSDNSSAVTAGGEIVQTHRICRGIGDPSASCIGGLALHHGSGTEPLDGGENGNVRRCEAVDQRNIARPIGPMCDVGATEAQAPVNYCQLPTATPTRTPTATPSATNTPVGFNSDTFCVPTDASDGFIRAQSAFYPPIGGLATFQTPLRTHRNFASGVYMTRVSLFSVNTSALDDLAVVTAARLVTTIDAAPIDTDGRRFVCEWYNVGAIDTDDYVANPPTTDLALDVPVNSIPSSGQWTQPLALANQNINRTGQTGLRCHISEGVPVAPPTGRNEVDVRSHEQDAEPCLEVDYFIPSPTPTINPTFAPQWLQNTPTVTPTVTPTLLITPSPTINPTFVPQWLQNTTTPTASPTSSSTPTGATVTRTHTHTRTATITHTPTDTPTSTVTPTITDTPTVTPTPTDTVTGTIPPTDTPANTPTITRTGTVTRTATITVTRTITTTPTITRTATRVAGANLWPANPTNVPAQDRRVRFGDLINGCVRSGPLPNPTPGDVWFDEAMGELCYAAPEGVFCGADPTPAP